MNTRTRFVTLAVIILMLCMALSALYPLPAGLLKPRHTWAMQTNAAFFIALAHIGIYVGLLLAYLAALSIFSRQSPKSPISNLFVWLSWMVFAFALLFSFPGESADIFDYIFRGRMMAEYRLSPLVTTPAEVQQYAFHRYVSWSQWVDAYGPLWEYASAGVSLLVRAQASPAELAALAAGNDVCTARPILCTALTHYITAYRVLALALSAVCGLFIHAIVKREYDVTTARVALLGWLWNPLVLVSTAIGAHNDVLMLVFILLGLWLFQRQKFLLGLLALLFAAHVKITALVLLPVFVVWLAKNLSQLVARDQITALRTARRDPIPETIALVVITLLIMLPVSWLLYAPLGGWATLPKNLFERSQLSTNSLGELAFLFLRDGLGWVKFDAQQPVARIFPIIFVLVAGIVLLRWLLRQRTTNLARMCAVITLLYLLIGSYWFQAWYLAWPIALAWLHPEGKLARRVLPIFATSAMIAAVLSDYLRNAAVPILAPWQISVLVVCLMGLALAVSLVRDQILKSPKGATNSPA